MIRFHSASTRMVNSRRAMAECLDAALGERDQDCDLIIIHASMGHDQQQLIDEARERAPSARIVGSSCCGVVGREGVSESMKDVAIMAARGAEHIAVAHVDGIYGHNSLDKAAELARQLKAKAPAVNMIYFLASGIDIDDDACIRGIESVFGPDVTIFGATSADNMKGVASFQMVDDTVFEHAAYAVGFSDPTLSVITQATHGFVAVGDPLVVTRATGNRIHTLNDRPAWEVYTERLQLPVAATCGDTIPVGALAERLPPALAAEYGNDHILRVVTKRDADGAMHYATDVAEGTELWLTVRDEARIFNDMDRMMAQMVARAGDRELVAVFHADCLARGRYLFNRVMKEELVGRMQYPLSRNGEVPPWLGMYGFGEFARLGGRNTYHNYTTALYAIYRDA
ncbi:MAG: FIST C-terminal domain-containing protein [Thiohalocapsa sp.]|uniref:FIST signal transduction protein n=1 Tax=Thiohalocapsa sp. TaxID=2497641 RepID=UPI0025D2E8E6|nr:FIST N-terminal domain-containing protein [Thiohalocapsa sp.]MCG6942909.1 FIST C-terminal domain-containing protein [Thiohalocapsa sp.]